MADTSRKRKAHMNPGASNNAAQNGRFPAKRAKMYEARKIATQSSDAALKDGELNLQAFLDAREFEIKALEDGMKKTKAAASTRAFQKVPRAMRRRTASHNVKRIPKRLRARARQEQLTDNTPTVESRKRRPRTTRARIRAETAKKLGILAERKRRRQEKAAGEAKSQSTTEGTSAAKVQTRAARPKIRRNALNPPPKAKSKFKKRQGNKTWLPTHLWHAKRARMTEPSKPLWRFAIPWTPSEKCYRPTHRASHHEGAVAWDQSYMSTIGLYGSGEGIERVFRALGLTQPSAWGQRGARWRAGTRKWSGQLSKERKGIMRIIGPATIVWNPAKPDGSEQGPQRQVFVRTHPACFLELFEELLKLVKMQSPQLYIEDLRFQIGSIELMGPASTEALLGVLHPFSAKPEDEGKEAHGQLFKKLLGVTNPATLPSEAVLGFSIKDPRLMYPPQKVPLTGGRRHEDALLEILTKWPAEESLQPFELFSRDARHRATQLPSQKALNRRKGANPPGKGLTITAADPPIPIILMASRHPTGAQEQGTWTLLAPWQCILPIWYSLMRLPLSSGGNPRFGGVDEIRQVSFEQGLPWFPADFPGTDAGTLWEEEEREKRRKDWGRRPKGKRVEWNSVQLGAGRKGEVGDGLACDYELLLGLPRQPESQRSDDTILAEEADDVSGDEMDLDLPESKEDEVPRAPKSATPLAAVQHLPKAAFLSALKSSETSGLPPHALTTVKLELIGRGVVGNCARIYSLPTNQVDALPSTQTEVPASAPPLPKGALPADLKAQWLQMLPSKATGKPERRLPPAPPRIPPGTDRDMRRRLLEHSLLHDHIVVPRPTPNMADVAGYPLCPSERDLLGFVTTGAYNLGDGRSTAIGSVSVERALAMLHESGAREGHLCVVRNAGESIGWLARWELV